MGNCCSGSDELQGKEHRKPVLDLPKNPKQTEEYDLEVSFNGQTMSIQENKDFQVIQVLKAAAKEFGIENHELYGLKYNGQFINYEKQSLKQAKLETSAKLELVEYRSGNQLVQPPIPQDDPVIQNEQSEEGTGTMPDEPEYPPQQEPEEGAGTIPDEPIKPPQQPFSVRVMLKNASANVQVYPQDTVEVIKTKFKEAMNLTEDLEFGYAGNVLEDDKTAEESGLTKGSTIRAKIV